MKRFYFLFLFAIAFILNCLMLVIAQPNKVSLPGSVQTILNKDYKKWKLVENVCDTAIAADLNGDSKTDYVVLITSQKGGSLVGFISNDNDFRPILIRSLDKRDAEISAISFAPKGKEVLISGVLGDYNARFARLNSNGFTLTTCEFNDHQPYIFKNGNFVNYADEFAKSSDQNQNADEFIVKGPKPWLDTGIDVAQGCIVILSPQGKVDVSSGWGVHDARGTEKYYNNYNYPVNAKKRYGLAAQITPGLNARDRNRDAWIYEYEGTHIAQRSGRLWLVVNDDNPQDNTGEFRVRVRTICDSAN